MKPSETQFTGKKKQQLTLSLVLSGFFLLLVLIGTAYFFIRFTDLQSDRSIANKTITEQRPAKRVNHASRKKSAFKFQRMMQQKEQQLRKKHHMSQKSGTRFNKQGGRESYRKWRSQKEQNERFLSKFKNDNTTDPNSVKMQLLKENEIFNADRPSR